MKKIPVRQFKTSQQEPKLSEDFSIRDIRDLLTGKDMVQELHRHDFFLILALKKGAGSHEIDFESYNILDQSVFFIRPGQVHQLTLKARSTGFLVQFKYDFYSPRSNGSNVIMRKASNKNSWRLDATRYKKLHSILTYIFQEYNDKQEGYQEIIKANLDIFFTELTRQKSKTLAEKIDPYAQERLDELLELIEAHVYSHKQVSQFADMLNLSSYQLNAITKAMLNKTCSELINEHIILESKRNLLATTNQVSQIAYQLGYEDVSYFIRFFKKHTGQSPDVFRRNFR